jgi:hypothetical protein
MSKATHLFFVLKIHNALNILKSLLSFESILYKIKIDGKFNQNIIEFIFQ